MAPASEGAGRSSRSIAAPCRKTSSSSILFGHEKGSFTGATERHTGKFVEASGGTLFLDEVGELPAAAQVKLLRAIQEGEVEPVGARKAVKVDVRIISATNRDLIADVKAGRFREDLFYRLHVFPIAVPPLRERRGDIPALARHFLARFAAEEGKRIRLIAPEALQLLTAFPWPGNIRQLENALFRAVVLADGDSVGIGEFPQIAAAVSAQASGEAALPHPATAATDASDMPDADRAGFAALTDHPPLLPSELPLVSRRPVPSRSGGRGAAARRDRGRPRSLCHYSLSRADVGGGATAWHRALDPLPQARGTGAK